MTKAQDPVRWGVLGTANIATKVGGAIRSAKGAELLAVASRSLERAESWARKHEATRAFGSYDELLHDPDVDVVYIPLPPSMHAEWTIRAAEHGKHVLCEKPPALNADDTRKMAAACARNGVQFMDGVMFEHHERTEVIVQALRDGALGELRRVDASFTFRMGEDRRDDIRLKQELGGGSLGDLGYYCVRAAILAFGELPTKVCASVRFENGVDMHQSMLLAFPQGRTATLFSSFDTSGPQHLEINGTHGSLICDDYVLPRSDAPARFTIMGGPRNGVQATEGCVQEVRMIERFSEIVRTGKLDERWPTQAIDTMRVCDAVLRSAEVGGWVEVA